MSNQLQKKTLKKSKPKIFGFKEEKDYERIDRIMQKIGFAWAQCPEQRFHQFLYNYTRLGTTDKIGYIFDPFHYDDANFEKELDKFMKRKKK